MFSQSQCFSLAGICIFNIIVGRQFSADSQVLADQIDDVFIRQSSSVSFGEELGTAASTSETKLSTDDSVADQQDGQYERTI